MRSVIFCTITTLLVFLFYAHTLNYPWKYFDEQIIYNETIFPTAVSLLELREYIKQFGLNHYFEASNPYYSSISNLRGTPVGTLFTLIIFFLFKKSAFNYHLFMLILHLINTSLCFFILLKISNLGETRRVTSLQGNILRIILVSFLTLIWALHPANVESVLFATNFGALITYMFCFLFVSFFVNGDAMNRISTMHYFLIFLLYLFTLFFNEYSITLPLILLGYIFAHTSFLNQDLPFYKSFLISIKKTLPFFIASFIYAIYRLLSFSIQAAQGGNITACLERIIWFSPQVFLHLIKILIFPIKLTIDQSAEVKLADFLFDPYAIFCFLLMYSFILFSLISFFFLKRKLFFLFFITFVPVFFSLLPFLHILVPIYNLASERYLYLPSFFFVFGLAHVLFSLPLRRDVASYVSTMIILFCILIFFSIKTYARTFDWKDSISLFNSSKNTTSSSLIKAHRTSIISQIYLKEKNKEWQSKFHIANKISFEYLKALEEKKLKLQNKVPKVIKAYGLDPQTLQAKTAYLIASRNLGITMDINKAYNFIEPYLRGLTKIDTPILDLYLALLFATNNLDKAEEVLSTGLSKNLSPTLLVIMSELIKAKNQDLSKAKMYLQKSFKYFPYDPETLNALTRLSLETSKDKDFAYFSYLYGLRTHSKEHLQNAYNGFTNLHDHKMAKVTENILKVSL